MRAVRRSGTDGEIELEIALRRERLQFKTHLPILNCRPDIVFATGRLVVFVDGDFWHGRLLLEFGAVALENSFGERSRSFWVAKIRRNVARDLRQVRRLRRHGWGVVRLWEKDVLQCPQAAAALVRRRLRKRLLKGRFSPRGVA
jgi:DNA mismatch endonuclease, patch repair protein